MPFLVKICGLTTPDAVDAAVSAGADMVGLVFFPPSPRHIGFVPARALAQRARGKAEVVALTVDADDLTLDTIIETIQPDRLQLHGHEDCERVRAIRARYGIPIIKAFGISTAADLDRLEDYRRCVDLFLLDAKPPRGATRPGGNGTAFDWSILDRRPKDLRFLLSGGLSPETVGPAVARTRPNGVDVSSGVEKAPGVKDIALISAFVRAARDAMAPAG